MLRRALFNLHMIAGLAAAVFLVVLGLTGSIMAFEEEIDRATHPHLFRVDAQGRTPLSLTALTGRLASSVPGRVVAYGMAVTSPRVRCLAPCRSPSTPRQARQRTAWRCGIPRI